MGNARSRHATSFAPCSAVKNPSDAGEQDVAPIEAHRALVEMRQSKEHRRDHESGSPSHAPFEKVLHPGAKEEFFRHGNEKEDTQPSQRRRTCPWQVSMGMDEPERQTHSQNDRRKEEQFAQSAFPIAPAQVKVETASAQLTDSQKTVQADVHEEQLIQSLKSTGPRSVEPAEIYCQSQNQQNDAIPPVAALLRV